MTRKYSPCWIKSISDKRLLFAVENKKKHHEENCKSSSLCTVEILHRPIRGGEDDKKGNRVGGSTSKEGGEKD